MKIPLHYQMSEYDCGPTSVLNAISFLFQREEIPPEVLRNIMLYCLDRYNDEGAIGKRGTSKTAMMFLSNWLNEYGKIGSFPVSSSFVSGSSVYIGKDGVINDALRRGGAVVAMVFYEVRHYVLLTGAKDGKIYMFDPYFEVDSFPKCEVEVVSDHPFEYNRVVPESFFNKETLDLYALGEKDEREAMLVFNNNTKLTEEKTIEYFI